jgi:2-octaprenyl-6-methoxyphenol hydroxylase
MTEASPQPVLDVAITGAGPTGLALVLALRRALGPSLRLAVFDPALGLRAPPETRASMIAADGRRLLEGLGAWPGGAPVAALRITDSRLEDALRPTLLELGEPGGDGAPFAHMVLDADLRMALRSAAATAEIGLEADPVVAHEPARGGLRLTLGSGRTVMARLLAAADGARSAIRRREAIPTHEFSYDQTALVATLAHDLPHDGAATQHFLPGGPFAMLPLSGNRCSLVWSERRATARRMAALDDAAFAREVERRAGPGYGQVRVEGPRGAFPLRFLLARSFVGERVALVGDAAHVVHPLAGQGFNLALRDVAALSTIVAEAARRGEDFGGAQTLRHYEQARRFEAASLAAVTDGLYRLFSAGAARGLRDVGMGLVDRSPWLKRRIVSAAAGL